MSRIVCETVKLKKTEYEELLKKVKTPKEELLIELGNKLMNNLVLLDDRIIGTDKFPEYKDAFGELLEIIDKIRELEDVVL